jgi:hypothetical protein
MHTGLVSPSTPDRSGPRRRGLVGAALAGAMVAIRDILERPRDGDSVTVEAAGEPGDIDTEGITFAIDDHTSAVAPPLPPVPVRKSVDGRRRRRR